MGSSEAAGWMSSGHSQDGSRRLTWAAVTGAMAGAMVAWAARGVGAADAAGEP